MRNFENEIKNVWDNAIHEMTSYTEQEVTVQIQNWKNKRIYINLNGRVSSYMYFNLETNGLVVNDVVKNSTFTKIYLKVVDFVKENRTEIINQYKNN